MKLELSNQAAADLKSIASYTLANWGQEKEEEYMRGIWDLLEKISEMPGPYRIRSEFGKRCQSARYRRHMIFFIVKPDQLEVLRMLHGAMDFGSHLPGDLE